jgi:hypothetical protein
LDDIAMTRDQRRGKHGMDTHSKTSGAPGMNKFLLYVGGHDSGGALLDANHFLGSYPDVGEARRAVPIDKYYTIMDGTTGGVAEKGSRSGDGEYHPVSDVI